MVRLKLTIIAVYVSVHLSNRYYSEYLLFTEVIMGRFNSHYEKISEVGS